MKNNYFMWHIKLKKIYIFESYDVKNKNILFTDQCKYTLKKKVRKL
jgi:hypothetical protein